MNILLLQNNSVFLEGFSDLTNSAYFTFKKNALIISGNASDACLNTAKYEIIDRSIESESLYHRLNKY